MIPASTLPSTVPAGLRLPRVRISFARPVRRTPRLGALAVQSGTLALTPGERFSVTVTLLASGATTAYWTLTANVTNGTGSVVGPMTAPDGATTAYGSGSGSVAFTSQALNSLGSYGVAVTLHVYADAARTQEVSGSPETRTAVPIVSVVSATPTTAPTLNVTVSTSTGVATFTWTTVANGQSYELQQTNSSGQQISVVNGGATLTGNSSGTVATDAQGVYGYFVLGTTAQLQLPAGATDSFRVRAVGGTAGAGGAGPWSNVVTASVPAGSPNIVYSVGNVSWAAPPYTINNFVQLGFTATADNQGTAAGNLYTMFAVVNSAGVVVGSGQLWTSGTILGAGQQLTASQGGIQVGVSSGSPAIPGSTVFTLHLAPSTPLQSYGHYLNEMNQQFVPAAGDRAVALTYNGPQWS
jgi:hypothetical protein